jgi:hypothetical protein
MTPSDDLRERVLASVRREPSLTRHQVAVRTALLCSSAVVVALVIFFGVGGARIGARPGLFVVGTALGWAVVALGAIWLSFVRGRSMMGRPGAWLWIVVLLAPVVLFGWMLLWNSGFPDTLRVWPGRIGLRCLSLTLAISAWPLVALAMVRRGSDPIHPAVTGAALGAAVGTAAGVLTNLWCPIANPAHVALGHVGPLLLLAAIGALLGRRLIAVRRRPSKGSPRVDRWRGSSEGGPGRE